jgi:hypothetical protein
MSLSSGSCLLAEVSLRYHVSLSSGPYLLDEASSGTATCPMARDSVFLRGELRCYHVFHDPRWTVDHRNKKELAVLDTQLGSHVSKTCSCVTEVPVRRACRYSVTL